MNEGGWFRAYIVCGYIMAICGFTMVYSYVALLIAPVVMQAFEVEQELIVYFVDLAANLTYLVIVFPILSSGLFIWFRGMQITWENRTVGNMVATGWNTYAQIHNTINAMRNVPSAFGKVAEAFGLNTLSISNNSELESKVKEALEGGKISKMRYENYATLYNELCNIKKW